jgi:hypothetical protein
MPIQCWTLIHPVTESIRHAAPIRHLVRRVAHVLHPARAVVLHPRTWVETACRLLPAITMGSSLLIPHSVGPAPVHPVLLPAINTPPLTILAPPDIGFSLPPNARRAAGPRLRVADRPARLCAQAARGLHAPTFRGRGPSARVHADHPHRPGRIGVCAGDGTLAPAAAPRRSPRFALGERPGHGVIRRPGLIGSHVVRPCRSGGRGRSQANVQSFRARLNPANPRVWPTPIRRAAGINSATNTPERRNRGQTVATGVAGEPTAPGRRSGGPVNRNRLRLLARSQSASSVR